MTQKIVRIVTDENHAHQATPSIQGVATQLFKVEDQPQIRLAHTATELTAAYRLVHDQYVKRGYQATDPKGVHFTPHFALPTSHTFIASIGTVVVGTLTMTIDGTLGLPMEQEYPDEIRALRKPGRRLAELSCLVTRRSIDLPVLLRLFHAVYAYALHQQGVTDFCIAVTTEHQSFYHDNLLFEQAGSAKPYAPYGRASAVVMRLHLPSAEQRYLNEHSIRRMLGRFFLRKNGTEQLDKQLALPNKDAFCTRLAFARTYLNWFSLYTAITRKIEDAYLESFRHEDASNAKKPRQTAWR